MSWTTSLMLPSEALSPRSVCAIFDRCTRSSRRQACPTVSPRSSWSPACASSSERCTRQNEGALSR
eukprot:3202548-Pyramimonas_sp.AAC.1